MPERLARSGGDHHVAQPAWRFTDNRSRLTIERKEWHFLALNPLLSWLTFAVGLFLMARWREGVLRVMGFGKKGL